MSPIRAKCFCVVALGALVAVGCKKNNQPAQSPEGFQPGQPGYGPQQGYPPQGYPPPQASAAPSASAAPGQATPLGAILSNPAALQNIISGALAGGAATLSALTGGELGPIQQGIKQQASVDAKGMKPDGQLMSAKLAQDGHAQGALTLQPGHCYTVVGFGSFGVFAYQVNLISEPPLPPQVLAQSADNGVTPVVGAGAQCIRDPYPLPMNVKVDMHVIKGQGMVGAQAYVK
jgi:hypothetical protein